MELLNYKRYHINAKQGGPQNRPLRNARSSGIGSRQEPIKKNKTFTVM